MLYVNDQEKAALFWSDSMGFHIVSRQELGNGMKWIEIAPAKESATTIVLHSKEAVRKMAPELNLGAPSLMFFVDSAEALRNDLAKKGLTVGQIMQRPDGKIFNFRDNEGNYFAVMERPT
jgi:lactoylglutathione lyase